MYLDHEEYGDPLVVGVVQVCTVEGLAGTGTLTENCNSLTKVQSNVDIWRCHMSLVNKVFDTPQIENQLITCV